MSFTLELDLPQTVEPLADEIASRTKRTCQLRRDTVYRNARLRLSDPD